jgi:hypothetical protein
MTEVQNTIVRWEALDVYFCGFSHIDCPFGFLLKKPNRNKMKIKEIPHGQNTFKIQSKNRRKRGKIVVTELT